VSPAGPSLLRRILERALPAEVREGIVGDLDELYRARRATSGALRARLWYASQVLAISTRFLPERFADMLPSSLGLDLKLSLRMLVKYPMLTIVGGIAITVASAIGIGATEFVRDLVAPELPLEQGDRIVRLTQIDSEAGRSTGPSLYDLSVWDESVTSLEDIGAFATMEQGFLSDRGEVGTVSLARTSPSLFELTRVPPLMGRFLTDEDARPSASPVVVLGYTAWQTLLDGDADPLGREVQIGGTPTTVVGIMPEGYGFPSNQNAWVPLRIESADLQPESSPRMAAFARLADGATLRSAQSELDVAGRRAAADLPTIYGRMSPRVQGFVGGAPGALVALALSGIGLVCILLLIVACANVATLAFARTVMREGEIAIRTSLGATRERVVFQLFAEALVLVGTATLIGMVIARLALGRISQVFFEVQQAPQPPFWWNDALSGSTIVFAGILVLVGALMIGVMPALKATGGAMQPRLHQLSTGVGGNMRLGGIWTVVIVLQVALTVALLPLAVSVDTRAGLLDARPATVTSVVPGREFQPDEYLTAELGRDPAIPPRTEAERAAFLESSARLFDEVKQRIAADPAVQGVALASGLSAMNHISVGLEFVGDGSGTPISGRARILLVDRSYLDLMDATTVAGQSLGSGDFTPQSRSVLVNEAFVNVVLGGRNPVGGRIRFSERDGEDVVVDVLSSSSVDVVGVVSNLGIDVFGPGVHPVIYAPIDLAPASSRAVGFVGMPQPPTAQLFVRLRSGVGGEAGSMTSLYQTVSAVDPSLRLSAVGTARDAWGPVHTGARVGAWVLRALAAIVLMLSVAGVYALMSFTVSRRTREIAIRNAVGARPREVVGAVFRRAAFQLAIGVTLGSLFAVPVLRDRVAEGSVRSLVIVVAVLLTAGFVACLVPVRRALAIEPAAAMKSE
jgi:putative ABC transport system permease protein